MPTQGPPAAPAPAGTPDTAAAPARSKRRLRGAILVPAALVAALAAGAAAGIAARRDLPSVKDLESWRPSAAGRIYAADGSVVAMLGDEKRIIVPLEEIPKLLRDAIIAVEDQNFSKHVGVDPAGLARAVVGSIRAGRLGAEGGASTITMQLAGSLFLDRSDKSPSRKIQEMMLALEIERTYSKDEILTFYCNQIYIAPRRYGVESGSQYYFGKPVREVTLPEAALLAGVIQNPGMHNPFSHPDSARERRRHVLQRMAEERLITRTEADTAAAAPLPDAPHGEDTNGTSSYFVEVMRRDLLARYGEESLYRSGLKVYSTLDPALQAAATDSLRGGLLAIQGRRGWSGTFQNVASNQKAAGGLGAYSHSSWGSLPAVGTQATALVVEADSTHALLRIGGERATLQRNDMAWSGRTTPSSVFRAGDLVPVRVMSRPAEGTLTVAVVPRPEVEGAVVAIRPSTGEVLALVGGYDFQKSQFDRATQSRRQPGSSFKTFVVATALATGVSPSARFFDAPTVFLYPGAPEPYQPENSHRTYSGLVTMRSLLEESVNIAAVRLLAQVGIPPVVDQARAMGITTPLRAYPSLALGALEVSPLELTSAYGTFPNQGVWIEPHFVRKVEEADGQVRETARPKSRQAMSPVTAYLTTHLLRGVIEAGTARRAASLTGDFAGKTGTTDDFTDAWFVGYSPDLCVGVWVGLDRKQTIGRGEEGARAALPIWMAIMERVGAGRTGREFPKPPGVVLVPVDRRTGLRAGPGTGCPPEEIIEEAYAEGSEIAEDCSPAEHARIALPYFLQEFAVGGSGAVHPDPGVLAALIRREPDRLRLEPDGRYLEVMTGDRFQIVPLALDPTEAREILRLAAQPADPMAEPVAAGLDGIPARTVTFP